MRENMEDYTWSEEPCSSFRDEVDKRMGRIKKVTKKSYKGCEACRWHNLNGGTCKGGNVMTVTENITVGEFQEQNLKESQRRL